MPVCLDRVSLAVAALLAADLAEAQDRGSAMQTGRQTTTEIALDEIQVRGTARGQGYLRDAPTSVATKLSLPLRQTPFTVDQVSAAVMEDRGIVNNYEALESFAGVTTASGNSDAGSNVARSISSRGFTTAGPVLVNGHRFFASSTQYRGVGSLARVELLRGPAGFYYGAGEPGGIVSYQYKRPEPERRFSIGSSLTSFGGRGLDFDLTGPIDTAKTLRYRVVGSGIRDEKYVDRTYEEPKSLLAALEWEPLHNLKVNATYEYIDLDATPTRQDNRRDLVNGGYVYDAPRKRYWGSLDDYSRLKVHNALLEAKWGAADWLTVNAYAAFQTVESGHHTTSLGTPRGSRTLAERNINIREGDAWSVSTGLDLSGTFMTGPLKHEWLAGFAYARQDTSGGVLRGGLYNDGGTRAPLPLDVYNPFYTNYRFSDQVRGWLNDPAARDSDVTTEDRNLYVQDLIHLPDGRTRLLAAVGYAANRTLSVTVPGKPFQRTESEVDKVTPRLAVMYDLTPSTTVYASYGQSFNPQSAGTLDINDRQITEPTLGTQYEVGLKQDLFGGRAMLTLAAFQIEKSNIPRLVERPDDPTDRYNVLDGLQRSRGFEISLSGQISDWWQAQAGYAYLDTEIVSTADNLARGRPFDGISRHNLAVWNKFRMYESAQYGRLDLGLGMTAFSDAQGVTKNPVTGQYYRRPAYAVFDAALIYELAGSRGVTWKAVARVQNLFDKTYYDSQRFKEAVYFGESRKFSLALKATF